METHALARGFVDMPGPDGIYLVMQFDIAFGQKQAGVETVTVMQEAEGSWKVAGYFIK